MNAKSNKGQPRVGYSSVYKASSLLTPGTAEFKRASSPKGTRRKRGRGFVQHHSLRSCCLVPAVSMSCRQCRDCKALKTSFAKYFKRKVCRINKGSTCCKAPLNPQKVPLTTVSFTAALKGARGRFHQYLKEKGGGKLFNKLKIQVHWDEIKPAAPDSDKHKIYSCFGIVSPGRGRPMFLQWF